MSIAAQMFVSERNENRIPLNVDGTLRDDVGAPIDVEIEDISASGFRARVSAPLDVDGVVSIGIAGLGTRAARVVRIDGTSVGCQFFARLPADFADRISSQAAQIVVPVRTATPRHLPTGAATDAGTGDLYSMPVRVAAIVGLSTLGWAAIFAVSRLF